MSNGLILVIDDEIQIRTLLEITLHAAGYTVIHASSGKDGLIAIATQSPDLVVLDLGLPDQSGHMVLVKLREWFFKPVIVLSVISNEEDIIKALDNGANDYLVKPFRTGELLARVRSALRIILNEDNSNQLKLKNFEIDLTARTIKHHGEFLKLTSLQYALFILFVQNEGKVLTHQHILRQVWGEEYINQLQYLRVFIAQLRKKIEKDPNRPQLIISESGIGYRFMAAES